MEQEDNPPRTIANQSFGPLIVGFVVALTPLVLLVVTYPYWESAVRDQSGLAAIGDYLGGVLNPVYGFMGLLAILYTLRLQIVELKLTRAEFERSAQALEESKEAAKKQAELLARQIGDRASKEKRDQLVAVVLLLSNDIERVLSQEIEHWEIRTTTAVFREIVSPAADGQTPAVLHLQKLPSFTRELKVLTEDLGRFLEALTEIGGDDPIVQLYRSRYGSLVCALGRTGMAPRWPF